MIAYICVGSDDLAAAKRFYSAFLPALGYDLKEGPDGLSYAQPKPADGSPPPPDFYVKPTFDGRPASAGNGQMTAFEVPDQRQVRRLYDAALAAGGKDEGAPGFRARYGQDFFVCYLRDPQGDKLALFSCNPGDPEDPGRAG